CGTRTAPARCWRCRTRGSASRPRTCRTSRSGSTAPPTSAGASPARDWGWRARARSLGSTAGRWPGWGKKGSDTPLAPAYPWTQRSPGRGMARDGSMIGRRRRLGSALREVGSDLGPGVITGAADDDPSGIATYTIAGATFGYRLLWTSIATLPMNFAVQSICARIGIVSGCGLATVIGRHYGRRWLYPVVLLLFIANVVNIGADIGAIAAAVTLLTGVPAVLLVIHVGVGIALVEVVLPYTQFARILRILTLVLFAYVICAFIARPDWGAALRATFVPRLSLDSASLQTVVAILGTTISPYLFFWQTSEEVEELAVHGEKRPGTSDGALRSLLRRADLDV